MKVNEPYVKKYNDKKELLNPITKNDPYLHRNKTQSYRNREFKNVVNNKKGIRLVVFRNIKTYITKQLIWMQGKRRPIVIIHQKLTKA
jgi:hypothetical protein